MRAWTTSDGLRAPSGSLEQPLAHSRRAPLSLAAKVRALGSALAYDDHPLQVEAIETHFAWVFLTPRYAYKLKKPVRTGDFDLLSLAAREASCREELRLNRRLSPEVYLGVLPLTVDVDGQIRVDGLGRVVDWLVHMRRLPSDCMLDRVMATHSISEASLAAIGTSLADFYAHQQRVSLSPSAYLRRMDRQIEVDANELARAGLRHLGVAAQPAVQQQHELRVRLSDALGKRATEGRIVEAHGDLRPEHICLTDPPRFIDALDFSVDLRTLDAGEDLAFLALECERAGAANAARAVLRAYERRSGDAPSEALLDFYISRRAMVRAKLMARRARWEGGANRTRWTQRVYDYLKYAERHAQCALEQANCP